MRLRRCLIPALAIAVLAACSGQPGKSSAQGVQGGFAAPARRIPDSAGDMRLSFAPVVRKAAPAVVNVFSRRVVRQQIDPFWQLFGLSARPGVEQSLGSGAIVRPDGVIVTNHHVISGGQDIQVVLNDRRQFPAKVLLDDARADIAVLKIDVKGESLPTLAIDDRNDAQVGDLVLAIGDPFGVGQTVTNGIVSALNRTQVSEGDFSNYIQTDASINPGNSGGPLVDMNGDLIGINTFIVSQSGSSAGVGFAIPATMVRQVVNAAVGGAHAVVRPWLGVRGQEVTPDIASSLGLAKPEGVLVAEVYPHGAADRAGLQPQDIILSVDGQTVNDPNSLDYAFATHDVGSSLKLEVRHGKTVRTVTVRTEPAPSTPPRDQRTLAGRNPLAGATVINLSPAAAQELGADPFTARGVMVSAVADDAVAARAGFQPGDIIRSINGRPIGTTAELQQVLSAPAGVWRVTILRGQQEIAGTFRL
jgi:Do/DeqQ family serine protease